jgi:dTDP-glucose 4,6-dehydratase
MANILVTGSEGTVGRPLVKELLKRKHQVFTVDTMHNDNTNHTRCDISKYRQVEKLFEKRNYDYVYNLAAEFGRKNGEDYFEQLWESNVIGMKNIIRLQEQKKFKLIHFSSSEIYGEPNVPNGILTEDVPFKYPIRPKNDYAISKWVNELQIRNSIETNQTETVTVRIFNAYGPGEYFTPYRSVVCQFIYKALHNIPYEVYKNYYRAFLYIDDLTNALANISNNFKPGEIYNIGSEEYFEIKQLSDMILQYLKKDDSLVKYFTIDGNNVVSKKEDISKAKADLGLANTPFSVGLPKTIEWQKRLMKQRQLAKADAL